MIQHVTHVFTDLEALAAELAAGAVAQAAEKSRAQLVQIYCAGADRAQLAAITSAIAGKLPSAAIVGATTTGEIAHGRLMTHHTVIGFTFFESSRVCVVAMDCDDGGEREVGAEIGRRIVRCASDTAGMLLLSTPLSIDVSALLEGLESTLGGLPVFGGGAGDYAAMNTSLVFAGARQFDSGAIAVAFSGSDLHVESRSYLGWRPLSRSMRTTQADGLCVRRVDDRPAFDIYRRYLRIADDDRFFLNALEFPFLLEREVGLLARVPIAVDADGALQFVADIREGETFRIGYGDIDLVIERSQVLHDSMARFRPQVVFLYTCGCRRFLMQEDVDLETLPFEATAPTFGFYTYGEFFGSSSLTLLNSTMLAVGLREGPKPPPEPMKHGSTRAAPPGGHDPYANKHTRVVSRLLRFIDAVTSELEASIREVTALSATDRLTRLANRTRLDQALDEQVDLARRYGTPFSIILLDVDHFKQVNDAHGHLAGDEVLVGVARILEANTRSVDVVGRWGGEEFLVIAPSTDVDQAVLAAEKLRLALEGAEFPLIGRRTGSFGVAGYGAGDTAGALVSRADAALYAAKKAGRNRVEVGRET